MSTHNAAENIYLLNETNRVENVKSRVHFMLITFVLISYLQREHGKKIDCCRLRIDSKMARQRRI